MIEGIGPRGLHSALDMSGIGSSRSAQQGKMKALAAKMEGITNDQGQRLLDFREPLRQAARSAVGNGPEAIQDAVRGVLEENGFDAEQVFETLGQSGGPFQRNAMSLKPGLFASVRL